MKIRIFFPLLIILAGLIGFQTARILSASSADTVQGYRFATTFSAGSADTVHRGSVHIDGGPFSVAGPGVHYIQNPNTDTGSLAAVHEPFFEVRSSGGRREWWINQPGDTWVQQDRSLIFAIEDTVEGGPISGAHLVSRWRPEWNDLTFIIELSNHPGFSFLVNNAASTAHVSVMEIPNERDVGEVYFPGKIGVNFNNQRSIDAAIEIGDSAGKRLAFSNPSGVKDGQDQGGLLWLSHDGTGNKLGEIAVKANPDASYDGTVRLTLGAHRNYPGEVEEQLVIQSSGDVGIGTSAPLSRLHVPKGYLQIPYVEEPPSEDCASEAEGGRMIVVNDGTLWVCGASSWRRFEGQRY